MKNYCKCGHSYFLHELHGGECLTVMCDCMEFRSKEKENVSMKVTLPNGLIVEGTEQQITDVATKLGYTTARVFDPNLYYNSSHLGWLKISEMSTDHLRNAMLKLHRKWAENLSTLHRLDLINALRNGNTDNTFVALLTEYVRRINGVR